MEKKKSTSSLLGGNSTSPGVKSNVLSGSSFLASHSAIPNDKKKHATSKKVKQTTTKKRLEKIC